MTAIPPHLPMLPRRSTRPSEVCCDYCTRRYQAGRVPDTCAGCGAPLVGMSEEQNDEARYRAAWYRHQGVPGVILSVKEPVEMPPAQVFVLGVFGWIGIGAGIYLALAH